MKEVKLQTPVVVGQSDFTLGYDNHTFLMGSCFTERMGIRLQALHFPVMLNPFGILYNPLSMAEALNRCLDDREIGEESLVFHDGLWHSWLHHGAFSSTDRDECLLRCNEAIHKAHLFLQQCDRMILTFGSAWHYRLSDPSGEGMVVANCHKVPAARFVKRLASVEEIMGLWQPLVDRLTSRGIHLFFTISPVRHWAYGAHGNQLGKAVLLLAVEQLQASSRDSSARMSYFSAYELMMDELRDYRFYADDMLHPSSLAEEIVWRRFQQFCMSETTIERCEQVDKDNRRLAHRPLHPLENE